MTSRPFAVSLALTAVFAVVLATRDTARRQPSSIPTTAQSPRAPRHVIEADTALSYQSLEQLSSDSSTVALLRPTGDSHTETIGKVPFTVTKVKVDKALAGAGLPQVIQLRQLGTAQTSGDTHVVSPAHPYLAYITPFHFESGGPVGDQYVVVGGDQGLFEGDGSQASNDPASPAFDRSNPSFARVHAEASALPDRVSVNDAERSAKPAK